MKERMMATPLRRHLCVLAVLACALAPAAAQQSNNHRLPAVPPPGKVTIDGTLQDWDLSGQIEVFANYRTRNTYSAKVAAMYDAHNLYLAVLWRDPTPLCNMVDANFDLGSGWKSDCLQLRLKTDLPMHLDCWYSTAAKRPVINIQYGSFDDPKRTPVHVSRFKVVPDALKVGAQEAFSLEPDGKSYVQEIALPWRLITGEGAIRKDTGEPFAPPRSYAAGGTLYMGMEFLWGGADAKTYPIHRYADLLKEGTSSREFFWTAENAWGPVTLEPTGPVKLPAPDYTAQLGAYLQKTDGPMALKYTMPFDGFATLVIEDAQGRRVKNLIGMAPRSKGKQVDYWDGTDESGKLVAPGTYRWRGLVHQGIDPVYAATYGNPGTPPWDTGDGRGAWMSDHKPPNTVAAGGDYVVLGADESEAGWGLICVDRQGKKQWGERKFHGLAALAADDRYVYGFMAPWGNPAPPPTLGRLELRTGKYAPFACTPEPQLLVPVLKPGEKCWVPSIAVGKDRIAVALSELNLVRFFDKTTAAVLGELTVPHPGALAYDAAGTLFLYSDNSIVKVAGDTPVPVVTGLPHWAADLAVDAAGRLFVADAEAHQVCVYGANGTLLRTIGTAGGRPLFGKWDPNGMRNPRGLDIDSQGRLWVAENDGSPKRVSVWNVDGALLTDFIGPTGYGGTGASADPDDKTRVFGSGCAFTLDYAANRATVTTAFRTDVGGMWMKIDGRAYLVAKNGALYLRDGDRLRLVAQIGTTLVKDMADEVKQFGLPAAPKGTHGYASMSYVWSDRNDDGAVQPDEVACGSPWTGWPVLKYPIGLSGYFGSFWLDERGNAWGIASESHGAIGGRGPFITKLPITGWSPGGAPLWDIAGQQVISQAKIGGTYFLPSEGKMIAGIPITCVGEDGAVQWTYKDNWQGVHGSHNAPIPERDDLLIGTLGCIGRASTKVGTVFAMHSNMGRLYLMTTDGLFVAGVFQDNRLGAEPWPNSPTPGAPLGGVTMGSEWFGGHFFKSNPTNEYYLIAGFTAYNLIKLNGFDSLTALPATPLKVTAADITAAEKLMQARLARSNAPATLTIAALPAPPVIDGKLAEYAKEAFVEWSAGPYRLRGAVACDAQKLYLAYDVNGDTNPMVNGGKDVNGLFTTGDSVDLQLGTDPGAKPGRADAAKGDLRLLISVFNNQPVAVLYRWKVDGPKTPITFTCPWRSHTVDSVQVLADVQVTITRRQQGYTVEAAVLLATLGFTPQPGKAYKLDLGVIFSDAKGDNRAARVYWANKATGLTADVPGEIMATPHLWGTAALAP
jgi:hypothetical protein